MKRYSNKSIFYAIAKILGVKTDLIDENVSMNSCQEWDSLKHFEIIIYLQKKLNLQINQKEFFELTSIKRIIQKVNSKHN